MKQLSRTWRSLALLLATLMLVAACGSDDGDDGDAASAGGGNTETTGEAGGGESALPDVIKIGVPLDTSGSAAVAGVGNQELAGVQLAADEINESGFLGDTRIELVIQDTKADKQEAVAGTTKLIERDEVDMIVGYTLTPSFLAAGPIAQESKVPVITVGLSASGVTDIGDYIFRIYPELTRLFGASDPQFVEAVGAETVAFLYGNDTETTVGQYEFRQEQADELGLETVAVQTVTAQDTDVRAQLTEIASAEPDVLFLNVNTGQQPGILTQAEELGLLPGGTRVIGDVGFGNATVLEQAAGPLECAFFATTWDISSTAGKSEQFVELYGEAQGGEAPDAFVAWGYDALWMAATAIKEAGSTEGPALRDALASVTGFEGALGAYEFDEERQPTQEGLLMQVQDGVPVVWDGEDTCQP